MRQRASSRRAGWVVQALGGLACLAWALPSAAEPYLAVHTGSPCASCHVNRTGGGMRNAFGAEWGRSFLPWRRVEAARVLTGELASGIRLGADFRGAYVGQMPEEAPYVGSYTLRRATIYLSAELLEEKLTLYVDQQVAPGAALVREAFALLRAGPHGLYFKAGRFFLPYGWRLQDDDVPARRFTGFNFDVSDTGVEVGAEADRWSLAAAVTNGGGGEADADNGKRVSMLAVYIRDRWRLGATASLNDLPGRQRSAAAGLLGGARLGRVLALAEWDRLRDDAGDGTATRGDAWHIGLDTLVRRGLDVRAWWGRHRAGLGTPETTPREQWGLGADWTPLPGIQLRFWYRNRSGAAREPAPGADEIALELHLFL